MPSHPLLTATLLCLTGRRCPLQVPLPYSGPALASSVPSLSPPVFGEGFLPPEHPCAPELSMPPVPPAPPSGLSVNAASSRNLSQSDPAPTANPGPGPAVPHPGLWPLGLIYQRLGLVAGTGKHWGGGPGRDHAAGTLPGAGGSLGSTCGGTGLAHRWPAYNQLKGRQFK